jgi:hypothetical protein
MWSVSRPGRFLPPGKTRYPLYRRLGEPQGRSWRVRKISPPTGIWSPDRPARSQSLYRLSYPAHPLLFSRAKKSWHRAIYRRRTESSADPLNLKIRTITHFPAGPNILPSNLMFVPCIIRRSRNYVITSFNLVYSTQGALYTDSYLLRVIFWVVPGVWCLITDISDQFVCSIFIGEWIWHFISTRLWRWNRHSVPKRRLLNTTRRKQPKRLHATFRTRRKLEIMNDSYLLYVLDKQPYRSVFSRNSDGSRSCLKMADYCRNM